MTSLDDAGQTLDAAEDELLAAMRSSDLVALDKLISDDLIFVGPQGHAITKEADLESHRTGTTNFERIDETERRSVTAGGRGATDTEAIAVLRIDGAPIQMRLLWHREWQIVDGQWKVVAGSVVGIE